MAMNVCGWTRVFLWSCLSLCNHWSTKESSLGPEVGAMLLWGSSFFCLLHHLSFRRLSVHVCATSAEAKVSPRIIVRGIIWTVESLMTFGIHWENLDLTSAQMGLRHMRGYKVEVHAIQAVTTV